MADDEDEDLYEDEFDFVDEDDDDDEDDDEAEAEVDAEVDAPAAAEQDSFDVEPDVEPDVGEEVEEEVDEYARPAPEANFVVHIYEHRQFKRTMDRPFTAEDAELFASEYNRTAKPYGRFAVTGKVDAKPRKSLD